LINAELLPLSDTNPYPSSGAINFRAKLSQLGLIPGNGDSAL
jgi:hypothetical protein